MPCVTLADLIAELRPTVIISRLRGAELTLFDTADLSGVRAMLVEFRPRIFGEKRLAKVMGTLAAKGLSPRHATRTARWCKCWSGPRRPGCPALSGTHLPRLADQGAARLYCHLHEETKALSSWNGPGTRRWG